MRIQTLLPLLLLCGARSTPEGATPSPEDWRDQTIYQIVTDRFFDGDPSNNGVEGNYDPGDGTKNHGGDWAGIEAKLDYIQGLGATAIWISPVQKNAYAAYHGYHIQDFYTMAPHFGGMEDLRSLVDAVHARGMYVILDVIANHGGDLIDSADPDYPAFQDPGNYVLRWRSGSNKPAPPFDDLSWYHPNGHIDDFVDPNQILGELFGLDDFRTEHAAVRDALIEAHRWLIDTTDADGFRIDTVKHVELDFWQEWGPAITALTDSIGKGDFFQFGEIFDGSSWKNGLYTGTQAGGAFALESTLWYPMYWGAGWVFRSGGPTETLGAVYADSVHYDPTARSRLVLFLDNHDNARFMAFQSDADHDDAKARLALTWMHTSLGVPCVYYGTEQEFDGGGDPWDREDMWDGEWDFGPSEGDNFDQTAPLYRHLRRMNEIRRRFPALRRGSMEEVASEGGAGLYAYYRRSAGEETVLVLLNTKGEADTLTIDPDLPSGAAYDLLGDRTLSLPPSGSIDLVVGGLSALLFASSPPEPAPWVEAAWPPHDGRLPLLRGKIELTFTEAMDQGSVESALAVTPSFPFTTAWQGRTLVLFPAGELSNQTTYSVEVGSGARSADGDSLGLPFSFHFEVDTESGPLSVPSGFYSAALPNDDLVDPLSLEQDGGRLLLGDTGWDRIFRWNDRGMVEAIVIDSNVTRPNGIAADRPDGSFGGDLLLSDASGLLRVHRRGAEAGLVERLASWPAAGTTWALAIGPESFGGLAYIGAPGVDSIYTVDESGTILPFAGGMTGVRGLAFSPGGSFGDALYAADGEERIFRVDPGGAVTLFADDASFLDGASALRFDRVGGFGGGLFVVAAAREEIVRVGSTGALSTFATGFDGLTNGPDVLAFGESGDLYVVENGRDRLIRIAAVPSDTGVPPGDDDPPPPHPLLLGANAPNPFNPWTTIPFTIPGDGRVRLSVHDVRGRLIRTLVDEPLPAGPQEASWNGTDPDGRDAPSGVYFYRLRWNGRDETRRMVLLR